MRNPALHILISLGLLFGIGSSSLSQNDYSFAIRSIDVMKQTQDAVCNPPSDEFIAKQIAYAINANATHIAISTPYDDPQCGSSELLTRRYIEMVNTMNEMLNTSLRIWHRHKPLGYEDHLAQYGVARLTDPDAVLPIIHDYIVNHPEFFREGDIITPVPEPQLGGIRNVNWCGNDDICLFDSDADTWGTAVAESTERFNTWLIDAVDTTKQALLEIGFEDDAVMVGMYGFDDYITTGDNDFWTGILTQESISAGDYITLDYYFAQDEDPNEVFSTIANEISSRYNIDDPKICIGEWGTIHNEGADRAREVMQAALDNGIDCFNYWHLGPGGIGEQLIDYTEDGGLAPNSVYDVVKEMFSQEK